MKDSLLFVKFYRLRDPLPWSDRLSVRKICIGYPEGGSPVGVSLISVWEDGVKRTFSFQSEESDPEICSERLVKSLRFEIVKIDEDRRVRRIGGGTLRMLGTDFVLVDEGVFFDGQLTKEIRDDEGRFPPSVTAEADLARYFDAESSRILL